MLCVGGRFLDGNNEDKKRIRTEKAQKENGHSTPFKEYYAHCLYLLCLAVSIF